MSRNRVTIQNIAEACGLSRNTVSKVFNNRGTVPESTKQLVLKKAKEMGYFAILENSAVETPVQSQPRSIAVFSRRRATWFKCTVCQRRRSDRFSCRRI